MAWYRVLHITMARTSKIPRYKAFNTASNTFGVFGRDPKEWPAYLSGSGPLILEVGCGKAELLLALAKKYPANRCIGIDAKADRLWRASQTASEEGLTNCVFIQSDVRSLTEFIEPQSAQSIWVTFPDPFPKKRHAKHRMLHPDFLRVYKTILASGGRLHVKTDNQAFFEWSLEQLSTFKGCRINSIVFDLHNSSMAQDLPDTKVLTTYEKRFQQQGVATKYLECVFEQNV